MSKRVWQVFVSGYVLAEASSAEEAERMACIRFDAQDVECPNLHYEATDDVTESPRFADKIACGDVLR
jgi:hypothetical protein